MRGAMRLAGGRAGLRVRAARILLEEVLRALAQEPQGGIASDFWYR